MLNINKKGFSLVELIIAIGVFGLLASGVFNVVIGNYNNFYGTGDKQTVSEFAQEGIEAVRNIRDRSWHEIEDNININLGVNKENELWIFDGSSNIEGDLTRVIIISNVSRNQDGEIDSSGTNDNSTKLLTVTVSGSGMDDFVLEEYLTNWDYSILEQTDWSGGDGEEFWNNETMYDSGEYIDDSIEGELKLIFTPGESSFGEWSDLGSDANVVLPNYAYDIAFSPDSNTAYVIGNTSFDLRKYDISDARNGNIKKAVSLNMPTTGYTIEVVKDGAYAFIGYYTIDGSNAIGIIDLNGWNIYGYQNTGSNGRPYDFIYDDVNNILYALCANGYIYTYSFSNGILTDLNRGQLFTTSNRTAINKGALINGYLFVVTDDSSKAIIKIDASNPSNLTEVSSLANSNDFVDIKYLETISYDRFLVATEDKYGEFKIIQDGAGSPSILSSFDLSGYYFKSLIYDQVNELVLMYDYYGRLFSIDISDREIPIAGPVSDTISYYYNLASVPYHSMEYNSVLGGIFILERLSFNSIKKMHFIMQPIEVGLGSYATLGKLYSSIIDLGSTNQELNSITINQSIPIGCSLNICLYTSDASTFSPSESICFNETAAEYTKDIIDTLDGNRWFRYTVSMSPCNSDTSTPVLESIKLNYE